jgi:GAF domain-containing protein/HAMP domain-containing protein
MIDNNQPFEAQPGTNEDLKPALSFWRQLRWTLVLAFIVLAMLPVAITVWITLDQVNEQAQEQIERQLESVADLKRDQISRWLEDSGAALDLLLSDLDKVSRLTTFLETTLPDDASPSVDEQNALSRLFGRAVEAEPLFEELFIYNSNGEVVASSNSLQIGKVVTIQPYFKDSLVENVTQIPYYEVGKGNLTMLITRPLVDNQSGQTVGVLAGRLDLSTLGEIMTKRTGLGDTGETLLVSPESRYLLTPSRFEGYPLTRAYHNPSIDQVLQGKDGSGNYDDYRDPPVRVFEVYRWIPELQAGLIAKIDETEALAPFLQARNTSLILAAGTILLAVIAGFYNASLITRPITNLTQVATQIAGGNLKQRAKIDQQNEIGLLATAFNYMTAQLQEVIGSLEERVAIRTQRLETVALLSEHLSAILHLEVLLAEVVDQIKEKFDYYHAHIYLLDDKRQNLVVAAGTGEAGAEMKARGHHIALNTPTSLVARAARTGEIVRVDNVREAEDWLPNPLLPHTYSEMAVPITLGVQGEIVGVLDVQQDKIAALDEGDANLLRTLANQIAVAIRNARLFAEVERALTDARVAQERYIEQAWEQAKATARNIKYHYTGPEALPLDEMVLTKAKQEAVNQNRPVIITIDHEHGTVVDDQPTSDQQAPMNVENWEVKKHVGSVAAPINLHSKIIGTLQLYPSQPNQSWTEDDLAIVEAVVNELALAAENLRLFEETREQANYERLVSDITQKIRQAPNMEILAKTAAEALSAVLGVSDGMVRLNVSTEQRQVAGENGHAKH